VIVGRSVIGSDELCSLILPLLDTAWIAALHPAGAEFASELRLAGLSYLAASEVGRDGRRNAAGQARGVSEVGQILAGPGDRGAGFRHDCDLDVAAVAARLGLHERTVRRRARDGVLPGRQLPSRVWLFDALVVADAERALKNGWSRSGRARRQRGVDQDGRTSRAAG